VVLKLHVWKYRKVRHVFGLPLHPLKWLLRTRLTLTFMAIWSDDSFDSIHSFIHSMEISGVRSFFFIFTRHIMQREAGVVIMALSPTLFIFYYATTKIASFLLLLHYRDSLIHSLIGKATTICVREITRFICNCCLQS
jgi:hypothetical protein